MNKNKIIMEIPSNYIKFMDIYVPLDKDGHVGIEAVSSCNTLVYILKKNHYSWNPKELVWEYLDKIKPKKNKEKLDEVKNEV